MRQWWNAQESQTCPMPHFHIGLSALDRYRLHLSSLRKAYNYLRSSIQSSSMWSRNISTTVLWSIMLWSAFSFLLLVPQKLINQLQQPQNIWSLLDDCCSYLLKGFSESHNHDLTPWAPGFMWRRNSWEDSSLLPWITWKSLQIGIYYEQPNDPTRNYMRPSLLTVLNHLKWNLGDLREDPAERWVTRCPWTLQSAFCTSSFKIMMLVTSLKSYRISQ